MDRLSWENGVRDGAAGKPTAVFGWTPEPGHDPLAYLSGYIEGKAFRDGYEVTMDVANVARGIQ